MPLPGFDDPAMEERRLNEATLIPAIGFGTYCIADEDAAAAVSGAIAAGYRHIDTAASYANETGVAAGIRAGCEAAGLDRDSIFVTTKFAPGWVGDPPKDRARTLADADASLAHLGMDYVDLYLIHAPFGGGERLNQWRALLELQQAGKARAIGVSNYNRDQLEEIRAAGLPMPEANQLELHPWSQKPDLLAYMQGHAIQPIAYSCLLPLSNWRSAPGEDSAKTAAMLADANAFARYAEKYRVSEAQFLLRWGLQQGFAVLAKTLNEKRLRENLDIAGFSIDEGDMQEIADLDRGAGVAWASGDPLAMPC